MTDLPPPDEMRRLFDAERLRDELPESGIDEAWQALAAKLPNATGNGGASAPASPAVPTNATPTARLVKLGAALLVTFGAGVLTGRLLPRDEPPSALVAPQQTVVQPRSLDERSASVASVVVAPTPPVASTAASTALSIAPARPAAAAPTTSAPTAPASSTRPHDALVEERPLIEGARTALLRGRPEDALGLARKHETQFPNGELAEDRDFMITSALRDLGRVEEARASARRFLGRYPKSALRRTVETMAN